VSILGVKDSQIENIEFEHDNKYAIPEDSGDYWGQDSEENMENTQGNWGISPVNDSDVLTSSTKRTLSPHISANDDYSDNTSTSSTAKKTKLG